MTGVSDLLDVFDASTVHRIATDKVIRRGERYRDRGAVTITALTATSVTATVRGTRPYEVRLDASTHPDWSCTCPAAADGDFCKHCVAVAVELAMIDAGESEAPLVLPAGAQPARTPPHATAPTASSQPSEQQRLIEFVGQLPADRLVALVMEQTDADWRLRERLLLEADRGSDHPVDLDAWTRRIDDSMYIDDYIDWRTADGWASDVFFVLDAMTDLLDIGHASAVIPLAEHAFRTVERAVGYVDDSNSGCLREISVRAGELHLQACERRPPDPVALARTLVDLELNSELEGLYHAVQTYADLLGDDGLAEYGRLLDALGDPSGSSARGYTVKSMRRAYIEVLDDVDALVAELRKDPGPHDVVTIMNLLAEAGRLDEAIESGRHGLDRFRAQRYSNAGIIDALAELLRRRDDADSAIQLYSDDFDQYPSLATLQRLLDAVDRDDRDRWLDDSIESIRQRVSKSKRGQSPLNNDVLVEVLMWAGRHEDAWDAAIAGGCNPQRWMELAAQRESSHPIDAIKVYEPAAIRAIEATSNEGYAAAVDLMARIRRLAAPAGVPERFEALLLAARTDYKRKRNLQRLLDQQGW